MFKGCNEALNNWLVPYVEQSEKVNEAKMKNSDLCNVEIG